MGHWLYSVAREGSALRYARLRKFSLQSSNSPCVDKPAGPWHLTSSDLLEHRGLDPSGHAIVFDIYPEGPSLNLYELFDIWGYNVLDSGSVPPSRNPLPVTWCPMSLRLETIFRDGPPLDLGTRQKCKESFRRPHERGEGECVVEFLYQKQVTRGGSRRPMWQWGKTGRVNAALLFGAAGAYIVSSTQRLWRTAEADEDEACEGAEKRTGGGGSFSRCS